MALNTTLNYLKQQFNTYKPINTLNRIKNYNQGWFQPGTTMKELKLLPERVKELKKEKKFYGFWELETRFGVINLHNQKGSHKEKDEKQEAGTEFFEDLQEYFFRK